MTTTQRPPFEPTPCSSLPPLISLNTNDPWILLITCHAGFPLEIFEIAVTQLIHHPEYNSTLILRSETLSETTTRSSLAPDLVGYHPIKSILRKLLPRRPGRDGALEQYCTFYAPEKTGPSEVVVLTPVVGEGGVLPYYHPPVTHLSIAYLASLPEPTLLVSIMPFVGTPHDPNSRLYRICLSLLDTIHRYGWGALSGYKKRVRHDWIVGREVYQDLYLVMRERWKGEVDSWVEVTDPLKHVYEDIGIATFLMLLWKETFTQPGAPATEEDLTTEPWKSWPRPPGGFLDFGCGNGLLTHILTSEGYLGCGIDVRARISWGNYPSTTQSQLHIHAFNPLSLDDTKAFLKLGVFIIGNHADELTPWVPVLSTLYNASGYLSIPCCSWTFDQKFERSTEVPFPPPPGVGTKEEFVESLCLGGDGSNASSYSMYRIWLASLSLWCGWSVECETLRIPSTRNWAIVGRARADHLSGEESAENINDILRQVTERGVWKSRKPEGKAGDH